MKVLVNSKEHEIAPNASITQFIESFQLPDNGIAVAVNNRMIPHAEWNSFFLKENDYIVIIKAACGG